MHSIISPLTIPYRAATGIRNFLYDHKILPIYKSKLAVISVGNVTVGGTGKTPICIYLAGKFTELGKKPVILSRGYKGTEGGPLVVKRDSSVSEVGDEPALMARSLSIPVVVARDRVAGVKYIEAQALGDTVILDDGLQHRRLARDVEVLAVNVADKAACDRFVDGELLPIGRFRESRNEALQRVHIVLLNSRGPKSEHAAQVKSILPRGLACIETYLDVDGLVSLTGEAAEVPARAVAVSGIANPSGFHSSLEGLGISLSARLEFADHHKFTASEIQCIREKNPGVPIIITAKDRVRMNDAEWGAGVLVLKVSLRVQDEAALLNRLLVI